MEQDDPAKRARGLHNSPSPMSGRTRPADVLATLGWAQYRSGHLDQAEKILRSVVQGVRPSPELAYFLAGVLADKGRNYHARPLLQ